MSFCSFLFRLRIGESFVVVEEDEVTEHIEGCQVNLTECQDRNLCLIDVL